LTFTNTVGAALGAIAGGFVLLPLLGMESSFYLAAIIYGGIGLLLVLKKPVSRRAALLSALVLVVGLVLFPFGAMLRYHIPTVIRKWADPQHSRIAGVREGLTETIIYLEHTRLGEAYYYQMLTNGFSMAGTGVSARRYMKLYVYLPVAMKPDLKNALLISYGVGSTAKALVDTRSIETIDVVDISREILEMNDIVFPAPADQPLHDPRVRVHIEDGRYFLQTTSQRFDLITGEPPPPENAGIVNLYTREYFQLIHDRLAEGGIVTYWLPILSLTESSVLSIMRAFCDVFDDASLWHGSQLNLMLMGTRNASGPVSEKSFVRQWQDPMVIPELQALGFEYPEQLGALFIGGVDYLKELTRDHPPLVDAWPKRIEKRVGQPGVSAIPLFRKWMDVASASRRFQQSPFIQRLWPSRLRADTLDFFSFQQLINMHFITPRAQDWGFPAIHQFLTQSSLEAPVLWMLGSDADLQTIFTHARPPLSEEPFAQFHKGVGLIAKRDFEAALVPLSNAETGPDMRLRITTMAVRIYVLCMVARLDEARELADELYAVIGSAGPLLGYWQFMKEAFGIEPGMHTRGN